MRTEKLKTQSQFNGRLDIAEEKINELEDRIKESIQNAAGETKRLKILKKGWENTVRTSNSCVTGVEFYKEKEI